MDRGVGPFALLGGFNRLPSVGAAWRPTPASRVVPHTGAVIKRAIFNPRSRPGR